MQAAWHCQVVQTSTIHESIGPARSCNGSTRQSVAERASSCKSHAAALTTQSSRRRVM